MGTSIASGNVGAAGDRLNTALQGFNTSISPNNTYKEEDCKELDIVNPPACVKYQCSGAKKLLTAKDTALLVLFTFHFIVDNM